MPKELSVVLPVFAKDGLLDSMQMAHLLFCFSVMYCVAQFVMGTQVDRFGGRRVVMAGMTISALATAATAFCKSYDGMLICQGLNGIAQATGWSGLMKMIKQVTQTQPIRHRGIMMGLWSTNYVVGGLFGTLLATRALTAAWPAGSAWQKAMWIPAFALCLVAALFWKSTNENEGQSRARSTQEQKKRDSWTAFLSAKIWLLGANYLLVKMVRYSLLFWLPLYLASYLGMMPSNAGYTSTQFELYGIAGALCAAYLSDEVFKSRRFPVARLMILILACSCVAASLLHPGTPRRYVMLTVAALGWATFGADTILVGAATQDVIELDRMGTVAGFVDGMGSIGQLLSPLFVAFVSGRFGWPATFLSLSAIALLCAALMGWSVPLETLEANQPSVESRRQLTS